ncbi:MAG: type signal peptidase signal peptidase endoplasmic reticulum-type [Candidatus Parcubacteria bacterium]
MKASKTLLKVPYYLLVVVVAAVGLLLLATLVPIPGNVKVKIVKSGSMEPYIKTGGIVVIKPAPIYSKGDVITFGPDTKTQIPTTHRIVEIKGEGVKQTFVTKGDANDEADPRATTFGDISGKVIFTAPYIGYVLDFAKKPIGFFLIVGIPAALVIFDEIRKIWREVGQIKMRRKKKKNGDQSRNSSGDRFLVRREYPLPENTNVIDLRAMRKISTETVEEKSSHFGLKTFVSILLIAGSALGFSKVGGTISYYNENEASTGNRLEASADFGFAPLKVLLTEAQVDAPVEGPVPEAKVAEIIEEDLVIIPPFESPAEIVELPEEVVPEVLEALETPKEPEILGVLDLPQEPEIVVTE